MGKKTKSKSKPQRSKATKRNMEEQQEERPMFQVCLWPLVCGHTHSALCVCIQITMADVHPNLKIRLESWAIKCNEASSFPLGVDRLRTIECFCASFVPEDVAEDEMKEYAKSLGDDDVRIAISSFLLAVIRLVVTLLLFLQENFQSLRRELGQCWSGEGVEGVSRSEDANTIQFTLLPPSDVETGKMSCSAIDIIILLNR